jgi:hypothetical protein
MKKYQLGGALVPIIVTLGVVFTLGLMLWGTYISNFDTGVQYENEIKAAWENNENILAAHKKKLHQALGTSKLNAKQVEGIITKALEARYGEGGNKASWAWIQENHPNLDQSINKQLMQIMEAGENEFKTAQTRMVDTKRAYETALDKTYPLGSGWWLTMAGFPKITLDDYKIITTKDAKKAFDTGIDEPMDML